jgi:hypothetical protein
LGPGEVQRGLPALPVLGPVEIRRALAHASWPATGRRSRPGPFRYGWRETGRRVPVRSSGP